MPSESSAAYPHERDYLERTIATVRNHRDADNCWPQWANIFANEIERLWTENEELRGRLKLACEPCAECGHVDYRELDDILGTA